MELQKYRIFHFEDGGRRLHRDVVALFHTALPVLAGESLLADQAARRLLLLRVWTAPSTTRPRSLLCGDGAPHDQGYTVCAAQDAGLSWRHMIAVCPVRQFAAQYGLGCLSWHCDPSSQPTLCSDVLLKKLTVAQLPRKFAILYGSWLFITTFTKAYYIDTVMQSVSISLKRVSSLQGLRGKFMCASIFSACCTHVIIFHPVIVVTLSKYKLWSSSLCNSPVSTPSTEKYNTISVP
jgi:hypothetical protein